MRFVVFVAAAVVVAASTPAGAQNYFASPVTKNARDLYAACASMESRAGISDIRASCACITGYMAGSFNDRDFEIVAVLLRIGEMAETGAPQDAIDAEVIAFLQKGYTEQEIQRVSGVIEQIAARGDAVCGQFEKNGSV